MRLKSKRTSKGIKVSKKCNPFYSKEEIQKLEQTAKERHEEGKRVSMKKNYDSNKRRERRR